MRRQYTPEQFGTANALVHSFGLTFEVTGLSIGMSAGSVGDAARGFYTDGTPVPMVPLAGLPIRRPGKGWVRV